MFVFSCCRRLFLRPDSISAGSSSVRSNSGQKLLLLLQQAIPAAGAEKIEMRNAERQKQIMPTSAPADESVPEFHNCVTVVFRFHIFKALELDRIRV